MAKKDKLHGIALGFRRGILGKRSSDMMCYAICAPLQGYLRMIGHDTEIVKGRLKPTKRVEWLIDHYWLKLPDGRILDPTADQFNAPDGGQMPKVYIGEKPEWYVEQAVSTTQD
jgi:hypothetical protein